MRDAQRLTARRRRASTSSRSDAIARTTTRWARDVERPLARARRRARSIASRVVTIRFERASVFRFHQSRARSSQSFRACSPLVGPRDFAAPRVLRVAVASQLSLAVVVDVVVSPRLVVVVVVVVGPRRRHRLDLSSPRRSPRQPLDTNETFAFIRGRVVRASARVARASSRTTTCPRSRE